METFRYITSGTTKRKNVSRFRIDNVKPSLVFTTEAVINFLSVKENLTSLKYHHITYGRVSIHEIAVNKQKYVNMSAF